MRYCTTAHLSCLTPKISYWATDQAVNTLSVIHRCHLAILIAWYILARLYSR